MTTNQQPQPTALPDEAGFWTRDGNVFMVTISRHGGGPVTHWPNKGYGGVSSNYSPPLGGWLKATSPAAPPEPVAGDVESCKQKLIDRLGAGALECAALDTQEREAIADLAAEIFSAPAEAKGEEAMEAEESVIKAAKSYVASGGSSLCSKDLFAAVKKLTTHDQPGQSATQLDYELAVELKNAPAGSLLNADDDPVAERMREAYRATSQSAAPPTNSPAPGEGERITADTDIPNYAQKKIEAQERLVAENAKLRAELAAAVKELDDERAERGSGWSDALDKLCNRLTVQAYDIIYEGEPEDDREPRWKWVIIGLRQLKQRAEAAETSLTTLRQQLEEAGPKVVRGGKNVVLPPGKYLYRNQHGTIGFQSNLEPRVTVFDSIEYIRVDDLFPAQPASEANPVDPSAGGKS